MTDTHIARRTFLRASVASAAALGSIAGTAQAADDGDGFVYEIQRSEDDWRARLAPAEYKILREGDTELPKTSPLWDEARDGIYCCKGCDLTLYDSGWKEPLDIGWAFFKQSRPDSILMGIDGSEPYGRMGMPDPNRPPALIEAHCRRCGSHLGHILTVKGKTLHCINGAALIFVPGTA